MRTPIIYIKIKSFRCTHLLIIYINIKSFRCAHLLFTSKLNYILSLGKPRKKGSSTNGQAISPPPTSSLMAIGTSIKKSFFFLNGLAISGGTFFINKINVVQDNVPFLHVYFGFKNVILDFRRTAVYSTKNYFFRLSLFQPFMCFFLAKLEIYPDFNCLISTSCLNQVINNINQSGFHTCAKNGHYCMYIIVTTIAFYFFHKGTFH